MYSKRNAKIQSILLWLLFLALNLHARLLLVHNLNQNTVCISLVSALLCVYIGLAETMMIMLPTTVILFWK